MLPVQPFYISVKEFELNSVTSFQRPDDVSYYGNFTATRASRSHQTLVLVHFTPKTQGSALSGRTATVKVNDKVYDGLPLTIVNITQLLYRLRESEYDLCIKGVPGNVTVHVHEVIKKSEEELVCDDGAPYVHKWDDTLALVRACLAGRSHVTTQSLQVSLVCPQAQRKIHTPGRGDRCSHIQCFDVYAYLACNEATLEPSWRCPVCSVQVLPQDIRVDLFTMDVLGKVACQCMAVMIGAHGYWAPVELDDVHSVSGGDDSSAQAEASPNVPSMCQLSLRDDT